jgi:hypothetical protein
MEMEAAICWGLTPFGFWSLPEMERALMVSHFRERRLRKAHAQHVENSVLEKRSKSKGRQGDGAAPTEHDRFFGA